MMFVKNELKNSLIFDFNIWLSESSFNTFYIWTINIFKGKIFQYHINVQDE